MDKPTRKSSGHSKLNDRTVLLIEEEAPYIERSRQKLEAIGFKVWTTYSIEEALYYLEFGINDNNGIILFFIKR